MKKITLITSTLLIQFAVIAHQFADKNYYLVDSLDLSVASENYIKKLDSILSVYHKEANDTSKIKLLNSFIDNCNDDKIWSKYNFLVEDLARKNIEKKEGTLFYLDRLVTSLGNSGYYYYDLSDIRKSIEYFSEALTLAEKHFDKKRVARIKKDLGMSYYKIGDLDKGLEYYYQALSIQNEIKDKHGQAYTLTSIGGIYSDRKMHKKSIPHFEKALSIFKEEKDDYSIGTLYNILGTMYYHSGDTLKGLELKDSALQISRKIGDKEGEANCLQTIANILIDNTTEREKAIDLYFESLEIKKEINDIDGMTYSLIGISDAYLREGNILLAKKYGEECYELCRELNYPRNLLLMAELMDKIYSKSENWKKAYQMKSLYIEMRDSLDDVQGKVKASELQKEYEYEKQKALDNVENQKKLAIEVAKKEEEKAKTTATVIILVLVILFLIFVISRLRITRKQKSIIEEQANKLLELDKTKTKFFNNVAHELRTPLTLMTGHMESMLNERFGGLNDNQRKSITVAKSNSIRLMELVSEILDLGKLESDKLELNNKSIELKPFLERIFFTFESLAYQFDIKLRFEYELNKELTLSIDDKKIEKSLNNLIYNAIKFTPRGGNVSLKVYKKNNSIKFSVKDTGSGIPKEDLNLIFDRYYQSRSNRGGTGIGLTIVKEFVVLHGGSVRVQSEIGIGSEFVISLPSELIVETPVNKSNFEDIDVAFPVYPVLESKDKTILVVEDHKEMQQYLKDIISDYAKVIIASDGIEALDVLSKNKVDLLTIDVMMPNMDGFKFLNKLKENQEWRSLPTIMLTARSAEEDKLNALTIGVNDYITKPFSQLELVARVANLIKNKISRDEESVDTTNDSDNTFLDELRAVIEQNIDNSEFSVSSLAEVLGTSEKQLTRTVKKITGLTPLKFIREIKLLKAQELLKSNKYKTVAEVCYAVGFEKPGYFSELFFKRFGKKPSDYTL